ncbi:NADP-dependent aldehyde dehydrogenase [Arthrobacter pigmenti]|uniref:NADP-dependent aldehyde dehydrogenase n=1 Tax=Arthrobacter pigmenti TaxID=271432 RepID=A0A846RU76_9MICC|nr:aldehyde dehydrogenase (NADP(+)) [Arthrobacter pigmenti]NJC24094.1 NADP-dependent aldehyde dehydrogenase [Arthrobacter pigmenti]
MTIALDTTTTDQLEALLADATSAADIWGTTPAAARGVALTTVAEALDAAVDELVPLAQQETHLAEARLRGELKRTTFQLRLFAEVLSEGSYLDARIDHADPEWPMGAPRPDLRRQLEPLGPVVVFAASNFPFAFSVAGGDTASALAAGCSVILKAHSGHPGLSEATAAVVVGALEEAGAPKGLFAVIYGTQAGRDALLDPRVKAGSFTGSIPGGRALFDLANSRPEPIPFYGELGSVNPTFVTRAAAAARAEEIASGFAGSFTMGAGQFCTKPGVLLVPADSRIAELLTGTELPVPAKLLNDRIQSGYVEVLEGLLAGNSSVQTLVRGDDALADPPAPTLLHTRVNDLLKQHETLLAECFGPSALVVSYEDEAQLLEVARVLEGQLTATIQGEENDDVTELVRLLAKKAGRVLWNQWPTGVSVTYAQQHGGPYPATTSPTSTSVGTAAINRFLRPVAYQGFPQHLLPEALQDANPIGVPQRINGRLS